MPIPDEEFRVRSLKRRKKTSTIQIHRWNADDVKTMFRRTTDDIYTVSEQIAHFSPFFHHYAIFIRQPPDKEQEHQVELPQLYTEGSTVYPCDPIHLAG
jgi:hypothetical protein